MTRQQIQDTLAKELTDFSGQYEDIDAVLRLLEQHNLLRTDETDAEKELATIKERAKSVSTLCFKGHSQAAEEWVHELAGA